MKQRHKLINWTSQNLTLSTKKKSVDSFEYETINMLTEYSSKWFINELFMSQALLVSFFLQKNIIKLVIQYIIHGV